MIVIFRLHKINQGVCKPIRTPIHVHEISRGILKESTSQQALPSPLENPAVNNGSFTSAWDGIDQ
jgi:hypothetical protein